MNKSWLVCAGMAAVLLSGCQCVTTGKGLDRAYQANPNSRTWTVFNADPDAHMQPNHRFRIQRDGDEIRLIPLFDLRFSWGLALEPGISVPLRKLTLTDDTGAKDYYCGVVEIKTPQHRSAPSEDSTSHGTLHGMLVARNLDDTVDVTFFLPDKAGSESGKAPSLEECTNRKFHGGTAHAEN